METNYNEINTEQMVWKKSWVAYVASAVFWLFCFAIFSAIGFAVVYFMDVADRKAVMIKVMVVLGVIIFLRFILSILSIKSYRLFCTDEGVVLTYGIFPWTKTVNSIRWRDLDAATYYLSAISWISKSYSVTLRHRYTQEIAVAMVDVANGDKAVTMINELHTEILRQNIK